MFPDESHAPKDKLWSNMLSDWALPGAADASYAGDTAVHELGHFFGLPHTFFQGDGKKCKHSGDDGIGDTPFEAAALYGCPVQVDSCNQAGMEGYDPIWNFMDYTDDVCMWRFSEQVIPLPLPLSRAHSILCYA